MALNRIGTGTSAILPPLSERGARIGPERPRGGASDGIERWSDRDRGDLPLGDAPPGTDPQLWRALTADERAFFARIGALGPLTYGPSAERNGPPVYRGLHLDVLV